MDSILQALGLANLFGGTPSPQVEKPGGVSGPAAKPTSAETPGSESAAKSATQAPLNNAMMQMLMASMLAQPQQPPQAPGGGPAPIRPTPFQYTPMGAPMAVGPRGRL